MISFFYHFAKISKNFDKTYQNDRLVINQSIVMMKNTLD